jgi:hypothetical protein
MFKYVKKDNLECEMTCKKDDPHLQDEDNNYYHDDCHFQDRFKINPKNKKVGVETSNMVTGESTQVTGSPG